jgi:hypothetical protein
MGYSPLVADRIANCVIAYPYGLAVSSARHSGFGAVLLGIGVTT